MVRSAVRRSAARGLPRRGHHGVPVAPTTVLAQVRRAELCRRATTARCPCSVCACATPRLDARAAARPVHGRSSTPTQYRLLRRETTRLLLGVGLRSCPVRTACVVRDAAGPSRVAGIRAATRSSRSTGKRRRSCATSRRSAGSSASPAASSRCESGATPTRLSSSSCARISRRRVVHSRLLASGGAEGRLVRIDSSAAGTASALAQARAPAGAQHAGALVLDLRGNPGGLLDQAVASSSVFLDSGVVTSIVGCAPAGHGSIARAASRRPGCRSSCSSTTRARAPRRSWRLRSTTTDARRSSVSARSAKALVQSMQPLAAGAALKLTVART